MAAAAMPPPVPTKSLVVGSYEVIQMLGQGSFATVYKGRHRVTGQLAAIKCISLKKLDEKSQANLDGEISIMRQVNHPHIVSLLEVQRSEKYIYLVLEYCAGGDLAKYIRKHGPIPEPDVRRFMRQFADGLRYLWSHNLIHRDLKPQNLLLTEDSPQGQLKIADFGFARHLAVSTLAETLCGSPLYMAPEILRFRKYDAKADLWSVGAILFEMLTKRPPFAGRDYSQLLANIERNEVRIPEEITVSPEALQCLQMLLKRNPVFRATFEEFLGSKFIAPDPAGQLAALANAAAGSVSSLTEAAAKVAADGVLVATQPGSTLATGSAAGAATAASSAEPVRTAPATEAAVAAGMVAATPPPPPPPSQPSLPVGGAASSDSGMSGSMSSTGKSKPPVPSMSSSRSTTRPGSSSRRLVGSMSSDLRSDQTARSIPVALSIVFGVDASAAVGDAAPAPAAGDGDAPARTITPPPPLATLARRIVMEMDNAMLPPSPGPERWARSPVGSASESGLEDASAGQGDSDVGSPKLGSPARPTTAAEAAAGGRTSQHSVTEVLARMADTPEPDQANSDSDGFVLVKNSGLMQGISQSAVFTPPRANSRFNTREGGTARLSSGVSTYARFRRALRRVRAISARGRAVYDLAGLVASMDVDPYDMALRTGGERIGGFGPFTAVQLGPFDDAAHRVAGELCVVRATSLYLTALQFFLDAVQQWASVKNGGDAAGGASQLSARDLDYWTQMDLWLRDIYNKCLLMAEAYMQKVPENCSHKPNPTEMIYLHALRCGRRGAIESTMGNSEQAAREFMYGQTLLMALLSTRSLTPVDVSAIQQLSGSFRRCCRQRHHSC